MPIKQAYLSPNKLTPPSAARHEIERTAGIQRVRAHQGIRVILVNAPAGFGKTTFMKQLLTRFHADGLLTAWLTLDENDNDESRFLASVTAALDRAENNPADRPGQDVSNNNMSDNDVVPWILNRMSNMPKPMAFFYDDFEVLKNPAILGLTSFGIEAMPPHSILVIGCRGIPDIGLARLRAKGQLAEIDASLLRFTQAETAQYFENRQGVTLNAEQVGQLQNNTEGWPAALWLASLALENREDAGDFLHSFSGSDTAIAAYLAEDVLAGLPKSLQDFLLRTSVLNELSPALCNAVCKRDDSAELLQQLDRENLFLVAVDEHEGTYRYHSLFSDFLYNQLQRHHAEEVRGLHRAAYDAYLAAGRFVPAIRHALVADAHKLALPLIVQHVDDLVSEGRLRLLCGWLEKLTSKDMDTHPRLKMIYAWCVTFTRGPKPGLALIKKLDEASLPADSAAHLLALRPMLFAMLDRTEEADTAGRQALQKMSDAYPFASAMLYQALTQTSIILGAHDDARHFMDRARRAQENTTGVFGQILAESAEALLDIMSGRLKQAISRLELATSEFVQARGRHQKRHQTSNALSAIQLAEALYEANQCEEARRLLEVHTPLAKELGPPHALITAHIILARIVNDQGDRDRAIFLLTELESSGHRLSLPRAVASARIERARMWLADGDAIGARHQLDAAEQVYDWAEVAGHWHVSNDSLTPTIGRLRWMIRTGAAAKALPLLREELAEAQRQQRLRRALKLRILLAEALQEDGQRRMALRAMTKALTFAQSEGFVRTFLEEGATVQNMLQEIHRGQTGGAEDPPANGAEGIQQWLHSADSSPSGDTHDVNTLQDPLTEKEQQVLRLLAQGLSNNAMADQLFVSESTVRTHLRSINLKLQAGSRTEAVAIARRMGMIA